MSEPPTPNSAGTNLITVVHDPPKNPTTAKTRPFRIQVAPGDGCLRCPVLLRETFGNGKMLYTAEA